VVGTHGRAAYILDDVGALRALAADPSIADAPLHLFAIRTAIQYRVAQVPGIRFTGDAMFIGDNRPYGALITYHLGSASGETGEGEDDGDGNADVTIEVADADGTVIRRFEGPDEEGINRTAWNLRRDGYRRPGTSDEEAEFLPSGPSVLPGTYTITVKRGDSEAGSTVEVLADPRYDISARERQAKLDLQLHAMQRLEVATEAIDRIRDARDAVEEVLEHIEERDDSTAAALTESGEALKKKLDALEERFQGPRDVQGIRGDPDAVQRLLGSAYGALGSSWDAPTESQRTYLEQAEQKLSEVIEEVNRVFAEDVPAFRSQVADARIELFPEQAPLTLDWVREN
jgi:hypothetical protein